MRDNVSSCVQVKAGYEMGTLAVVVRMIEAGVTRIGATANMTMCDDFVKLCACELKIGRLNQAEIG